MKIKLHNREFKVEQLKHLAKRSLAFAFVQGLQYIRRRYALDYRLISDGTSFYPNTVSIELTDRCNLSCVGCKFYGESGAYRKEGVYAKNGRKTDSMSLENVKKIIDQVAFFKPLIIITGGEPLLNPDCLPIIDYIHQKGLVATLETNGTLITDEMAEKLIRSDISVIMVSVDGPEEVHDKWRGRAGAFQKAVGGLKKLREIRGSESTPILNISYTIERDSFDRMSEFIGIAEDIGVDTLQYSVLNWITSEIADRHKKVFFEFMRERNDFVDSDIHDGAAGIDTNILVEQVREIHRIAQNREMHIRFSPHIDKDDLWKYEKYYKDLSFILTDRCYHPWFACSIKANGDVSSCVSTINYLYGNIFETSFKELWNCEKVKRFRRSLRKIGHFPACIRCPGLYSQ